MAAWLYREARSGNSHSPMSTTLAPVNSRETIRCDNCLLVQFRPATNNNCRRCHVDLDEEPEPELVTAAPPPTVVPFDGRGHPNLVAGVLASTIRSLRLRNGLSQRQLSTIMSVPRTYVSKIENERATPTIPSLYRLARALGVTVLDLISPGDRSRQEAINDLMKDGFVAQLLPYVACVSEPARRIILARVRDMAVERRRLLA